MKRILSFITLFALLLTACTGDPGPPGPPGLNGVNFVGQSFETNPAINFTSTNGYQVTIDVPLNVEILESDMVLVYRLIDVVDGFDVWKLLPETIYTNTSEFQYNFEHNFDLITLFIDAPPSFDYNTLLDSERLDQIFRVVILPVDFINSENININDFNEVMNYIE